jgi:hypothetical protein
MSCKGLHCSGCGNGGGGVLAAIVAVVIIGALIARPVEHAADIALHILEIVAYCLAGLAGAAGLAAGAWLAVRWRRRSTATMALPAPAPVTALPAPQQAAAGRSEPLAIAPARPQELHLHLHNLTADDIAVITRQLGSREEDDR